MTKDILSKLNFEERRFWAHYLYLNIRDALGISSLADFNTHSENQKRHHRNTTKTAARIWMFEEKDKYVGSFEFVCCVLNLDPDLLRERIKSGKISRKTIDAFRTATKNKKKKGQNDKVLDSPELSED